MTDGRKAGRAQAAGADLVLPAIAALYGGYYLYTIWDLPFEAQINGFFIIGVLAVLIAAFVGRVLLAWSRGHVTLGLDGLLEPIPLLPRRITFFLMTLATLLLLPWLGFTLTTFLFVAAAMYTLGIDRLRTLLLIAGATAAGGYLFFIAVLDTRFPRGPVEYLLEWLI